jgi:hypothetical protein
VSYSLVYTDRFNACISEYSKRDPRYLAELMETVAELSRRPFGNPQLQTHGMKAVPGEKRFISYVGGSKGRRLIWSRFNRSIVLLLYGEHDVEEQAERLVITSDGVDGGPTITERVEVGGSNLAEPAVAAAEPGQLFVAWSDPELRAFGFAEHEVPVLRRLDTEGELLVLGLADASFERAYNLLAYQDPLGPAAEEASEQQQIAIEAQTRELRADERKLEAQIQSPMARKHFLPVSDEELRELLAAPVEDWMVFLHPDQAELVERTFSGPARVRGAAGTGKTVVGLHRARHLAQKYEDKVLFTTYVNNLPPVFGELFKRLADADACRVEFVNLHKIALGLVAPVDGHVDLNREAIDSAFAAACSAAARPGGALRDAGLTRGYLREEIDWVIKGRGLVDLDEYLVLARTGRGTPLGEAARREAWDLYEEYQRQLERRKLQDFNDIITRAIELLVLGRARSPYRAVVIDEAQDLTQTGLQLAFALAGGGRPDGLFILGDGQQSVYPGGVNLLQAGIDVRGRSTMLKVNYRNPQPIADLARRLVFDSRVEDLSDEDEAPAGATEVVKDGESPELEPFDSVDAHDAALVARIEELTRREDTGPGDIAVLLPTNRLAQQYESLISRLGLRTQKLTKYDGVPSDAVKVGTYQRGKGLEFKRVFIPRLDGDGIGDSRRHGEDEATHAERIELLRRQVYVAITRARDGVWLGWVGSPSQLVNHAVRQPTGAGR